jgi:hypothetical protein
VQEFTIFPLKIPQITSMFGRFVFISQQNEFRCLTAFSITALPGNVNSDGHFFIHVHKETGNEQASSLMMQRDSWGNSRVGYHHIYNHAQ